MTLFFENDRAFTSSRASAAVAVQTSSICPRCNRLLNEQLASGEGVFTCRSCKGWWIPEGVLTRLHGISGGGPASIELDETSLYARAAAAKTKHHHRQAALVRRARQGSSAGLFYWTTILAIVLLIIILVTVESLRHVIANGQWAGKPDESLWLLAVGVIGGMAFFVSGVRLHRRTHLIETTPTASIRSLAIGQVEITGRAEPAGPMLSAPFSAMPCVFFSYKVEERQRVGKQDTWVTIAEGQSPLPFTVRDATGAVMIMPSGAQLMIEPRGRYVNSGNATLPETVEAGLAALGVSSSGWVFSTTLRCTESFILPEESVYILGTAQEGDQDQSANEARLFIGRHPDGVFMISDRSERDLLSALRWKVLALLYGGPALTAACAWGLLRSYVAVIPSR